MVKEILLGEINGIEVIGGQITSRVEAKNEVEKLEEIKVLIPKSINKGIVEHSNLGSLNIKSELDSKKLTHEGDIVMKLSTPYDTCLITKEDETLLVPSFCAIIRVNDVNINKNYLVAFLNSNYCLMQIKTLVSGSMAMLSTGTMKKINIILPDIEKQNQMALDYHKVIEKEKILKKIIELEYEKIDSEIYEMKG